MSQLKMIFFSVRLFSVLRGHWCFSSPPQRPMTSDFEGFYPRSYPLHFFPIFILVKVERTAEIYSSCQGRSLHWWLLKKAIILFLWNDFISLELIMHKKRRHVNVSLCFPQKLSHDTCTCWHL